MKAKATVIIPTFNHGPTLRYALQSALNQTVKNIELFVIGDGVPDITRTILAPFLRDRRVRFFDNPKGPRHGEIYRHRAINDHAKGEIICYLSDDDLWFPEHLEYMGELLEKANFSHALPLQVLPDGSIMTWTGDFSLSYYRKFIRKGENFVPLSCAAHTLAFYKRLPYGWRTSPKRIFTDLYMWQQILVSKECRPVSGTKPTVLHFPNPLRKEWPIEKRLGELEKFSRLIKEKTFEAKLLGQVVEYTAKDQARLKVDNNTLREELSKLNNTLEDRNQYLRKLEGELFTMKETFVWKSWTRFLKLQKTISKAVSKLVPRRGPS